MTGNATVTLKVKEAWWLRWYLRWVIIRSMISLTDPDFDEVKRVMDKAITVEVEA